MKNHGYAHLVDSTLNTRLKKKKKHPELIPQLKSFPRFKDFYKSS